MSADSRRPDRTVLVPDHHAPFEEVMTFGYTYDGYGRHADIADFANAVVRAWERDHALPADLSVLRACLFYEQRRWRHFGDYPDPAAQEYQRALVSGIREISGGTVTDDGSFP